MHQIEEEMKSECSDKSNIFWKKFSYRVLKNKNEISEGFQVFQQNLIDFCPKIGTRLLMFGFKNQILDFRGLNPKSLDRRLHKFLIRIDKCMRLDLTLKCYNCTKLKNDCLCQKSEFKINCFSIFTGVCQGVNIKLYVRRFELLFDLLDFDRRSKISTLGYLIHYDKLDYSLKMKINFKDIKHLCKHFLF